MPCERSGRPTFHPGVRRFAGRICARHRGRQSPPRSPTNRDPPQRGASAKSKQDFGPLPFRTSFCPRFELALPVCVTLSLRVAWAARARRKFTLAVWLIACALAPGTGRNQATWKRKHTATPTIFDMDAGPFRCRRPVRTPLPQNCEARTEAHL